MIASGAADRVDAVGVLGGMGPLATADFMRKVIELTPAAADPDHIPLIVSSYPQIPDRVGPIMRGATPSPFAALCRERQFLEAAGAKLIVMPCNTAHFWYDDLLADATVPFLHIVDAAADGLVAAGLPQGRVVGLIATKATLKAGMFQDRLRARGYASLVPTDEDLDRWTVPGIARVKANRLDEAATLFRPAIEALLAAGADRVILACTEVPPAFPPGDALLRDSCVDATEALARATVAWALARRKAGC